MPGRTQWDSDQAARLIDEHKHAPGALLPILHALQDAFGYVDAAAVPLIASALNLSRAEVHGVISFYHDFRDAPPGRHVVKLCRAEACQSMGSARLIDHVKQRLGIDFHQTSADGRYTLEPVFCLGDCSCAPALTIDGKVHGRVDPARFDALLERAERRR
ncbi:MAG: formate dehydrogenase subunit gamma [Alphaproteobacteria bacterium]